MSGQGSLPASNHASTSSDNISTTSSASSKLSWSTPWLRHNNQGVTHVFFPASITIDLSLPKDEAQRLKDAFKLAARSGIDKVKRRIKELEQQVKDLQSQLLHSKLSTGRTIDVPDPSERSFSSSYLEGYPLPPPMTYHRLRRTSPVESLRSVYTEHSSRSHLSCPSIQISDFLELDNIKGRTNYAKAVISRDLNRGANPRRKWSDVAMASSEVDTKFLAQFANNISGEQPLLSSQLYRVLGNLTMLAPLVIRARKERRLDPTRHTKSIKLYCTIIWYARNGLIILEEYILPMTTGATELRVLAHKLRASYFHLYVLFHNSPPITLKSSQVHTPPGLKSPRERTVKLDKGKGIDRGSPDDPFRPSSVQPTHPLEGGPVGGEGPPPTEFAPDFLIPAADYRGTTLRHFEEACAIADNKLWGSHPLRLSAKVEMCAFLYDCLHMHDRSRLLAKTTIAEVYNAVEGMDDDMFEDAAELVGILGRMMKRGLGSGGSGSAAGSSGPRSTPGAGGMLNPI